MIIMDKKIKILVDETSDGLDIKLQSLGYDAQSVKKLRPDNEKLANDFNIMLYVKKHDMVLVTKDQEHGKACHANQIKCILISDDLIFDKIILPELQRLESI